MKLVDPNGDTAIAYDHFSKKMIRSYLKEIFGKNNLFRFSGYTLTGNPAATFTHELLDEVLNHYIYKRDNANSSKLDRVAFQNAALRTMNCKQRNGEDHE